MKLLDKIDVVEAAHNKIELELREGLTRVFKERGQYSDAARAVGDIKQLSYVRRWMLQERQPAIGTILKWARAYCSGSGGAGVGEDAGMTTEKSAAHSS